MDDVDAAIQALEWGKKEFMTGRVDSSETLPRKESGSPSISDSMINTKLSLELQHVQADLFRTRSELEESQRRCHQLENGKKEQRQDRDAIERELLLSRTMQTEKSGQLHSEIRSLQQQLWQARQDVEHWRAKETQSQLQLSSATNSISALKSQLKTIESEHKSLLTEVQQKLEEALAERDAVVLEARQLRMEQRADQSSGIQNGDVNGEDSLPHQVAKRLRQAAKANEELRVRLDSAEVLASRAETLASELAASKEALEEKEGQIYAFESALKLTLQSAPSSPVTLSRPRTTSVGVSPFQSPLPGAISSSREAEQSVYLGLAKSAGNVATNASDMLHLLTTKHSHLLQHVRSLTAQLQEAQSMLIEAEGRHKGEVSAMEEAHRKILQRLQDIGMETSSLNDAVRRKTHLAVEKAVHEMAETLSHEKKLRSKAERTMKDYRERVEEWEMALQDADNRAARSKKNADKSAAKLEKLRETLNRAKKRIAKLELDRSSLRDAVRTNRLREAQLAEQAATQAEIQVS